MYEAEAELDGDHWWFRVRRQILADLLRELAPTMSPIRDVLDVGCGTGSTGPVLGGTAARPRTVVGIDAHPLPLSLAGDWAKHYALRARAALPSLPFPDASFDLIVALDVLEHVKDDRAAAAELKRVLRAGGALVVFVPAFEVLWGAHDDVANHHRRYSRAELIDVIAGAGLEARRVTYFNSLLFPPILVSRLLSRVWAPEGHASDTQRGGPLIGALLGKVFSLERSLLRHVNLPVGVSLAVVASRPAP